jgi:hypothetical protein
MTINVKSCLQGEGDSRAIEEFQWFPLSHQEGNVLEVRGVSTFDQQLLTKNRYSDNQNAIRPLFLMTGRSSERRRVNDGDSHFLWFAIVAI